MPPTVVFSDRISGLAYLRLAASMSDVTQILLQVESGDPSAAEELLPLVYDELRKLAAARLAHDKPGQTLQATALVHEAYLRLVGPPGGERPHWDGRKHFFAAAAEAMRRILIDQARAKGRQKRFGDLCRFDIDTIDVATNATPEQILAIDDALDKLAREDPAIFELVRLRYFVGLNIDEAAAALGISRSTAYRHWNYARAWLHGELLGQAVP
jgi:RNA polymerase sigma factor (TIGR02999 family)